MAELEAYASCIENALQTVEKFECIVLAVGTAGHKACQLPERMLPHAPCFYPNDTLTVEGCWRKNAVSIFRAAGYDGTLQLLDEGMPGWESVVASHYVCGGMLQGVRGCAWLDVLSLHVELCMTIVFYWCSFNPPRPQVSVGRVHRPRQATQRASSSSTVKGRHQCTVCRTTRDAEEFASIHRLPGGVKVCVCYDCIGNHLPVLHAEGTASVTEQVVVCVFLGGDCSTCTMFCVCVFLGG